MALDPSASIRQAAAIPVKNGELCLVTSRSGKRWVIPKGTMEPGKTAGEIALQEAWEEAGLTGVLQHEPIGSYLYEKFGFVHHVIVFIMRVTGTAKDWPEENFRRREWVAVEEAVGRLNEPGLRKLIEKAIPLEKKSERARVN